MYKAIAVINAAMAIIIQITVAVVNICRRDSVLYSIGAYCSAAPIMFIAQKPSESDTGTVPCVIVSIVTKRLTNPPVKLSRLQLVGKVNGIARRKNARIQSG